MKRDVGAHVHDRSLFRHHPAKAPSRCPLTMCEPTHTAPLAPIVYQSEQEYIMTGQRTVALSDYQVTLLGREDDPYFRNFNYSSRDNQFLNYVVSTFVDDRSTVFDVGANIGTTTILFNKLKNCRVYAFEPSLSAHRLLKENIERNGIAHATLEQCALSDKEGTLSFDENLVSESASVVHMPETLSGFATITVQATTIDQYVTRNSIKDIAFIKIDVEGYEQFVLLGGRQTIDYEKPLVFTEVNSYTLIAFFDSSPRKYLDFVKSIFPYVYYWRNGTMIEINTEASLLGFLHCNLIEDHCVSDILCSFRQLISETK
jgi:FkbM family methyltransferase